MGEGFKNILHSIKIMRNFLNKTGGGGNKANLLGEAAFIMPLQRRDFWPWQYTVWSEVRMFHFFRHLPTSIKQDEMESKSNLIKYLSFPKDSSVLSLFVTRVYDIVYVFFSCRSLDGLLFKRKRHTHIPLWNYGILRFQVSFKLDNSCQF